MVGSERADESERPARAERAERAQAADADLLALLQAFLPRPCYLRDLGIEMFPLVRLNARLAPLGYVIEVKKVRDRTRFVTCTDAHGQVEPFGLFTLRAAAVERLGRLEHDERSERLERTALLTRLRAMQADGLSLQAIANQLNAEGVPTLSGTGHWQKGTVGKLLAQAQEPKP